MGFDTVVSGRNSFKLHGVTSQNIVYFIISALVPQIQPVLTVLKILKSDLKTGFLRINNFGEKIS
jgi:hypothetical protein